MTGITVEIVDSCFHVPDETVYNSYFEGLALRDDKTGELTLKTNDEWIAQRTGIKERRRAAKDEFSSDLAIKAAQKMFETSEVQPEDLDGIIVATSTPDRHFPATANYLQKGIGARKDIFAYDLGSACAAFMEAVGQGQNAIKAGEAKYVLVMAAETLSKINDYSSANCPLFGDGAAGVILGPNYEGRGFRSIIGINDYDHIDLIFKGTGEWAGPRKEKIEPGDGFAEGTIRMPNGPKVLKLAINYMSDLIQQAAEKAGWKIEDIDLAICHQANKRITEGVEKKIPGLRVYDNIYRTGNISSVTCPACFHEAKQEGLIKPGSKIAWASLGSGLKAYGAAYQN